MYFDWNNEQAIRNAVNSSATKTQTLCKLGYSPKGSAPRLKLNTALERFNIDISHFQTEKIDWSNLPEIVRQSSTVSDILRGIGLFNRGNNYKTVKRKIVEQNIDSSHIDFNKKAPPKNAMRRTYEEIFCENSTVERGTVRRTLLRDALIPYSCNKCENEGVWNNESLTLQLEHKNGISNDNRIENLEFLCPNCHSQTTTWGQKKRK